MSKSGILFVYSGPSGVGKGTILTPYLKSHPETMLSISMTTRAPRPGETHGVEYYFVNSPQFEEMIATDGLLEYAKYSGNYYGTPRAAVEEQLAKGINVVLEIEVQGAEKIRESFPEAVFIFVLPPSYDTLKNRLTGRGTESPQVVETRLSCACDEVSHAREYDYVIVNDDVDAAREKLAAIIIAAGCRPRMLQDLIGQICG